MEANDYVTVVAVENCGNQWSTTSSQAKQSTNTISIADDSQFVTVVAVNDCVTPVTTASINGGILGAEIVTVYRLPGERIGFGLKFQGGAKNYEKIERLFIQSCSQDSPAARAIASWGSLKEGDEILNIDSIPVTELTRLECVKSLKESNVAIKFIIKNGDEISNKIKIHEKSHPPPPPPVPPRKIHRKKLGSVSSPSTPTKPIEFILPPDPESYTNLFEDEMHHDQNNIHETESDDTGSTISTVIDHFSISSDTETSPTETKLDKVLKTFMQLEELHKKPDIQPAERKKRPTATPPSPPTPRPRQIIKIEPKSPQPLEPTKIDPQLSSQFTTIHNWLQDTSDVIHECIIMVDENGNEFNTSSEETTKSEAMANGSEDELGPPEIIEGPGPSEAYFNFHWGPSVLPTIGEVEEEFSSLEPQAGPILIINDISSCVDEVDGAATDVTAALAIATNPVINNSDHHTTITEMSESSPSATNLSLLSQSNVINQIDNDNGNNNNTNAMANKTNISPNDFSTTSTTTCVIMAEATAASDRSVVKLTEEFLVTEKTFALEYQKYLKLFVVRPRKEKEEVESLLSQLPPSSLPQSQPPLQPELLIENERIILGKEEIKEDDGESCTKEEEEDEEENAKLITNSSEHQLILENKEIKRDSRTVIQSSANSKESPEKMEQLLCIVEKETLLLPPTFSRLPPDGDEFPPNFSEPITIITEKKIMNENGSINKIMGSSGLPPPLPKSVPPKTAPRKIYRQDFIIEVSDKRGNCDAINNHSNNNHKTNNHNNNNNINKNETIIQLDGGGGGGGGGLGANVTTIIGNGGCNGDIPKIIEDKAIRKTSKKQVVQTVVSPSASLKSNEFSVASSPPIAPLTQPPPMIETVTTKTTIGKFSTVPRKTSLGSMNWRKDEKSEKSVRDKIAMFSNARDGGNGNSANNCQQTLLMPSTPSSHVANNNNNSTVKRIPSIAKSTENLNWNNNARYDSLEGNLNNSHNMSMIAMKQKAVSVEHLDRPDDSGTETKTHSSTTRRVSETKILASNYSTSDLTASNLYNTLPRKTMVTGSHPALARATSFTGYNNTTPGTPDDQRKAKINNLLERRKKSISKLRGLVIPEKTMMSSNNSAPVCFDLPEIKSKELERIKENNLRNKTMSNGEKNGNSSPHWASKKKLFSVGNAPLPVPKEYKPIFQSSARESSLPPQAAPPMKPPRNSLVISTSTKPVTNLSESVPPSTDSDDSDSVFSSQVSSPPLSPEKYPLTRTLSSETNTSIASSTTSTLTSGSGSQASCSSMGSTPTVDLSRRVQKSDSINNRRNVLVSARCRSGRDEGSLLARQKSQNDDDSTDGCDDIDFNRTPKPKKRNLLNYKLATNEAEKLDKNINVATYVEVVAETEVITRTASDNGGGQMSELSKWVRQEATKVQPTQRSINTTVPKLSTAEIRKAFEAKNVIPPSPVVPINPTTTPPQPSPPPSSQFTPTKEIETHHDRISSWDSISSYSDIVTTTTRRSSRPSLTTPSPSIAAEKFVMPITSCKMVQEEIDQLIAEACPPLEKPEAFVVTLARDSLESSIGITLAGGSDYEAKEVTIHRILKNSPADKDGQLKRGDRILAINSVSMKNLTHGESVTVLKTPRIAVEMVITRSKSLIPDKKALGMKAKRLSLGSLSSLVEKDSDSDRKLKISHKASRSLDLDALDTVNPQIDSSAAPIGKKESAVPVAVTKKTVMSNETVPSTTNRPKPAAGNTSSSAERVVEIVKDGCGLGFSIEGGHDSPNGDVPLLVKKVFMGGAAEKSGKVNAGNEVIAINGTSVLKSTRVEVWNLMKELPQGVVSITFR